MIVIRRKNPTLITKMLEEQLDCLNKTLKVMLELLYWNCSYNGHSFKFKYRHSNYQIVILNQLYWRKGRNVDPKAYQTQNRNRYPVAPASWFALRVNDAKTKNNRRVQRIDDDAWKMKRKNTAVTRRLNKMAHAKLCYSCPVLTVVGTVWTRDR